MMLFTILLLLIGATEPARSVSTLRAQESVEILVTDRSGTPLTPAHVRVFGTSEREGDTNSTGRIVFLNMKGSCSGCPSSTATLKHGIQNLLRHFVPDVVEVRPV